MQNVRPIRPADPAPSHADGTPVPFSALALSDPIQRALADEGYEVPTPVQAAAIPPALAGRDVLGCATGTGKTAAFALPILQRLSTTPPAHPRADRRPVVRCLVLSPTRELATQIADSFRGYGRHLNLRHTVVFGGVGQNPQADAFRRGVDIVVATPGRLLDLLDQRLADLRGVEVLVLDEADRMLDMGFIRDVRKIVAHLPAQKQTMLFSATMPTEIRELADSLMRDPVRVQVARVSQTADKIDESVYLVHKRNKPVLLAHLVQHLPMHRAIVFTRTKHGADKVVRHLDKRGIRSEAIHGNKSQNARQRALDAFKADKVGVLVATDIASRGIDIDGVTHVVNYDLTHEPETYIHRIGRTARAGATGAAVSFCGPEERENLRAIERLIRRPIPVCNDHPEYPTEEETTHADRQENDPGDFSSASPSRRPERADRSERPQPFRHASNAARPKPVHPTYAAHAPRPERSGHAASSPRRPHAAEGQRPAAPRPHGPASFTSHSSHASHSPSRPSNPAAPHAAASAGAPRASGRPTTHRKGSHRKGQGRPGAGVVASRGRRGGW